MHRWGTIGLCGLAWAVSLTGAAAEDESKKDNPLGHLLFGGTLEGYYETNSNDPFDRLNDLRAYDLQADSFGIQQATALIESPVDVDAGRRYGVRFDFQFGQATDTVQGNPANEPRPETWRNVWQAYGIYVFKLGNGLTADFGKFASNLGFETNYAKDNNNFSRAYLCGKADRDVHADQRRPADGRLQHAEGEPSHADLEAGGRPLLDGQLLHEPGAGGGLRGRGHLRDLRCRTGLELRPRRQPHHAGGSGAGRDRRLRPLAARYEHLDDEGLFGGVDQTLQEGTLTAECEPQDGFLIRAEVRRDWSDRDFFTGADPLVLHDTQDTALLGFVWWFGNKKGAW